MINGRTKLACLIGSDVSESKSPQIHNYIYDKLDINCRYLNFSLNENELSDFVTSVKTLKIPGFNVTIPYKEKIIGLLDEIDDTARKIGAVNTVKNLDGKLIGYNTDGAGYVMSLKNNKVDIKGKKILVIGAGGAARGILFFLSKENPKSIHIMNRTKKNAEIVIDELKNYYNDIEYGHYDDKEEYDIIINTTSIGMKSSDSPYLFTGKERAVVSDIVYNPRETRILKEAKDMGLKTVEGIEMLIYQAILADEIWFDTSIDSGVLVDDLKEIICT
ncbi:MAG: shikimate dehydrogenase [Firmicutes bacterium]|jgi:shikimate dehydrogenase|nr:shikimate dehydrogenase [Bacillota bacterium]